ncbi:MAG: hypothetical protein B7Z55_14405, partial [Planctomycetales bacterium 12-60-4]
MSRSTPGHGQSSPSPANGQPTEIDVPPPHIAQVLDQIQQALDAADWDRAQGILNRTRLPSPWMSNAIGVCQIRGGHADAAVQTYRRLVLSSGGLQLRDDIPVVCKLNFALALLCSENFDGFESIFAQLSNETHPAVEEVRRAYQEWRSSLTLWQRVRKSLVGVAGVP